MHPLNYQVCLLLVCFVSGDYQMCMLVSQAPAPPLSTILLKHLNCKQMPPSLVVCNASLMFQINSLKF